MVHVNLRPKNITVQVDEKGDTVLCKDKPILSIIDFDWAGVADEKVGENYDRILLENCRDAFVKSQPEIKGHSRCFFPARFMVP